MIDPRYPVKDAEHAFRTGLVMGCFMKAGIEAAPDLDRDGNYMTSILVTIPEITGATGMPVKARIVVLPEDP
jgi:hypothetical protein